MANPTLNLVHENETQRRHARIKIPARLVVQSGQNEPFVLEVQDLSASGFSVEDTAGRLRGQQHYDGRLLFSFDNVEFALAIRFQVVNHQTGQTRFGCEFHDLGEQEIATLRLLITKFLGGEITRVGDVLSTMNRENFTKTRKQQVSAGLSGWQRVRALVVTLCSLAIGISALGYLASKIYDAYFVTMARSAVITEPQLLIRAPRDANVTLAVKVGDKVSKDAQLATLTSPIATELPTMLAKTGMDAKALQLLISSQINTTINSPCDCQVASLDSGVGYQDKGALLLTLAPQNSQPYVQARFDYTAAGTVQPGTEVQMQLVNGSTVTGHIRQLKVGADITRGPVGAEGALLADIQPDQPLARSLLSQPLQVRIAPDNLLSRSMDRLHALVTR